MTERIEFNIDKRVKIYRDMYDRGLRADQLSSDTQNALKVALRAFEAGDEFNAKELDKADRLQNK